MSAAIIGIDLGTTNSCVSVLEGQEAVVIHNHEGRRTTPSMVSWQASGEIVVGAPARRQMVTNPAGTVFGSKRLIGRRHDEPEVARLASALPFALAAADNGDVRIRIGDELFAPQHVAAHVLKKMREIAEDYLGVAVNEAIITVPAYFDEAQRQATKDAGAMAGLTVRALLNEPTAAALAYGVHRQVSQRVAVVDLGGGTFDVSILAIDDGVFEVLATAGDTRLGGDDFDQRIVELLTREFSAAHDHDLLAEATSAQRLKEAAERAKIELSTAMSTDIQLPFIAASAAGPLHLQRELSRGEVEAACRDLLERLEPACRRALEGGRCEPASIDQVLLVGGMTRMPAVQARVRDIFGREPFKGVHPDEIVAMGAAVQGGIVGGEIQEVVLLDVTPHTLGLKTAGDRMSVLIPENTAIPTRARKVFATTEDDQEFVSLEVYQGAAAAASQNRFLGRFILGDLPRRRRGEVRVEVEFTLDADGLLEVRAAELSTGRATSVTIAAASGLAPGEVERVRV
jgi:molecular chaperone DnaK